MFKPVFYARWESSTDCDGSIAVLRSHVENVLTGKFDKKSKTVTEPNWGALHATRS